ANATFVAQTGNPFSVVPANGFNTPTGGNTAYANKTGDPFATGGNASDCAAKTKTRSSWFNYCSFSNPWVSTDSNPADADFAHYIPKDAADAKKVAALGDSTPVFVQNTGTVIGYLGGKRDTVVGPGYERVNMSIFKNFKTYREQNLEFRADIFNLFNTPSLADPSDNGSKPHADAAGEAITGPKNLQRFAPDSRFIQLSLKYAF